MKRILLALLLVVFAISIAHAASKPQLEKITFVHYIKGSQGKPTWDENVTDYKLIAGGIKWKSLPIRYSISLHGKPSNLDNNFVISAINNASETWDEYVDANLYEMQSITNEPVISGDGNNTVGWGVLPENVIAVTHLWYNPATKEIVEFDIVFNTLYKWGNADPDNDGIADNPDVMDLQNIATHEFGHNGLDDLRPPKDSELTMYYKSDYGEIKKRTLGIGDILGIQKLYGS
ncbi:peptidase M10A and M12B matrixin and adamalysin [Ferroglobus placidus DSM 10642]|uniref:Peptidase M10A and M12B matrixin and adamalysin n=1 Tax=Ferroglobus placidus (strain DSM 10642 / AEDII12DO) TaxID=589924 RepID=D3S2X3_FERPA|nr:peptidase M10A and M12B matrixin and adamalysin [Ferroglobus placidus DSM 10642]